MPLRSFAVVVFVACAAHQYSHDEPGETRGSHQSHPCDPEGAAIARWEDPVALERSLSPDERVLRGPCSNPSRNNFYGPPRSVIELAQSLNAEATAPADCTGTCQPMVASLPSLDDTHDLEDETLQRECAAAVTKLAADIRVGCRHVCLVDRRRAASKAIFARLAVGLFSFTRAGTAFTTMEDAAVRSAWRAQNLPMPPKRFKLSSVASKTMSADGTMYPSGPALRLQLIEGDAGCGATSWTVLPW